MKSFYVNNIDLGYEKPCQHTRTRNRCCLDCFLPLITSRFEFHGFDRDGQQVDFMVKKEIGSEQVAAWFTEAVRKFFAAYPGGRIYSYFDSVRNSTVDLPEPIKA